MNKCITVILNKCYEINQNDIKDINKTYLELNMEKAKEIIRDANLKACHACNKSSDMWKNYYFDMRAEAESEYSNLSENYINTEIENEYEKRLKKINDKEKLSNKKYINKIRENVTKDIKKRIIEKIEHEIKKKDIERYGKDYCNVIQGTTKLIMKDYNTSNVGTLDQQLVQSNWKRDKEKILDYEARVPQYKKETPFYFYNKSYKLINNNGNFYVELFLFSIDGYEKNNLKRGTPLNFKIDKIDGNKIATLNKIINGEYKQGSAQIIISDKGKIEFTISFSFEPKQLILDKNRILGIDLGIVNVATMSIWDNNTRNYDYINYQHNMISGKELISFRQKLHSLGLSEKEIQDEIYKHNQNLHQKQLNKFNIGAISGLELTKFRSKVEKHKDELSIASKYVGEGREGHGYRTRVKPLEKIRNKVSNFADTFNHKYSKYIVEFAVKNNCGVIQMENLSGATSDTYEKFLKDWSYYDLQNKVEYKAKEKGIIVVFVNPKYTSKRCSKCGCIHKDNRNCKENQGKFKCILCDHEENADINAAKNISLPNIDKIIADYIKEKKLS